MILKMAFRNIFRHRIRSILTLASLAFGIFFIIVGIGLNIGMEKRVIKIMRETETGDYKLYGRGYFEEKYENIDDRLNYLIPKEALSILKKYDHSSRLVFSGVITDGRYDYPVRVIGGDREVEDSFFKRSSYLTHGNLGVVIASTLAKDLDLDVGDPFVLRGTTTKESLNAIDLVVTGIIKTGGLEFDLNTVLIDLKSAQEFTETDDINDIVLRGEISPKDLNSLDKLGVEVISYLDELFDLIVITKLKVKVVTILSCIILFMSGVGIVNTMLMAMLERQKEIGILMANGLKPKEIMKLFLLEGSILGGIGSGIGFILGGSLVYYYEVVGIPIPSLARELSTTIPLSDRIYGYFDLKLNLLFLIFGIIIAAIASFYPAYKATQLNPIDVIRE